MGIGYKAYRKLCFFGLEMAREKGIEVDKRRTKEEWDRKNSVKAKDLIRLDGQLIDRICRGKEID